MRKWNKKALVGTVGLLTAGFLAACGSGNSSEEANSDTGSNSSKEVSFWFMGDGNEQVQPILDSFTEETGIKVNVQSIPWSAAHDRLLTAVASGEGPDVVQMGTTWMSEFSDAGALMDITDYINSEDELNRDNFFEGNVGTNEFDGKYYGVPWYTETRALYYRSDLLEDIGYSEAPKTWDELKDAALKLSKRGDNMYGFNVDGSDQTFGFMFARQNGSKLLDKEGNPLFNQKPFVESAEYLNSMIQNGSAPAQDLGIDISQSFGGEGIVPMFISGPWMITAINENASDIDGKWATAVLPAGPENNLSNTGGANLSVWNGTDNTKNAIELIKFMSKPENQLTFLDTSSSLPAVKSAWEDEKLQGDKIAPFGEQLESSEHMPLMPKWEEVAQKYLDYWEQITVGGADIQDTLDAFNKDAASILKK
ncbi:sugar ABC transporter substrate-binding protein [Pisciglobus halotolerans]|uniref:Carbohydrate ABC transporter substrate-binding protein, CUT1 family n=1 Tax=Pisciglobus halotolerans TaxID=745365 RepID=A0A1I3AUZ0_9LACT|nr:sugar ABC transporter substrate-binding protein [Pisciglobus halotolerans]SFH53834.1 carbohydrate ABC transporter substrate-binding protein, CUT1 family [Pisciglobus halotolerans]